MQTYETLFITTPTLTEDEERSTVETLAQIVTEGGGTFAANERMGRRRLAYPIEKHTDGVYIRFLYDAESEVPKELERRIRLSDRILRALTVRLETKRAVAAKEQHVHLVLEGQESFFPVFMVFGKVAFCFQTKDFLVVGGILVGRQNIGGQKANLISLGQGF